MVVIAARQNRKPAVQLLKQDKADELVGKRDGTERYHLIGLSSQLIGHTVSAADDERDVVLGVRHPRFQRAGNIMR